MAIRLDAFIGNYFVQTFMKLIIKKHIDYEKLFDKALYKKIKTWYEALNWSQPVDKQYTLNRFFSLHALIQHKKVDALLLISLVILTNYIMEISHPLVQS